MTKYTNNINKNNFPHSILIIGERGSGKHKIYDNLCNILNFSYAEDITDKITKEFLSSEEIQNPVNLIMLNANLSRLTVRQQNMLLKLFEEPSPYLYLCLFAENDADVLDTIKTRSYNIIIDKYTRNDLEELIENDNKNIILNICNTPGQIETANRTDIKSLNDMCVNMVKKMKIANYQNALTISNKINFSDEYDKYDLFLFIKMLSYELMTEFYNTQAKEFLYAYLELKELNKRIWLVNNKKQQFERFISKYWRVFR